MVAGIVTSPIDRERAAYPKWVSLPPIDDDCVTSQSVSHDDQACMQRVSASITRPWTRLRESQGSQIETQEKNFSQFLFRVFWS